MVDFITIKNSIYTSVLSLYEDKNIRDLVTVEETKKDFERFFNIKIEYLENRKTNNLSISNKYNGSKIFLAYYYKGIRLIDNF